MSLNRVRIDRWLWSVRAYKTRSLATDACKRNWVSLNGNPVKPSREIKCGDLVIFKLGPLKKEVKVVQLLEKRVSAKLVEDYMEDLTPKAAYEEAEKKRKVLPSVPFGQRLSKGKPSKKERREIEEFFYNHEE